MTAPKKKTLKTRFIQVENPKLPDEDGNPTKAKIVDTTFEIWSRKGWRKIEAAAEFVVDDNEVTVVAPGETPEGVTTDENDPNGELPKETDEERAAREAVDTEQPPPAGRLGRR